MKEIDEAVEEREIKGEADECLGDALHGCGIMASKEI
jgi:hypothetical protein